MTVSPNIRILLINADGTHKDDVTAHLSDTHHYTVKAISPEQIPKELVEDEIDLVIFDLNLLEGEEEEMLASLRAQAPSVPLIVVSLELGASSMRQLFKFHVQDWIGKPISGEELVKSVRSSVRSSKANSNRVHAIMSAVGGAGATTTAISMADIASSRLFRKKSSVGLFDLDFSTGNCGYVLNMVNKFDLGSVAASPRRIDGEFIRVIQQQHSKGFYLYSFKQPALSTDMNGYELVLRLLDAVNQEHDYTFLDVPYYETEWKDDVLSAVNTCTIVTELNLPAIKHALDNVERVKALRGDEFPVRVVINKRASSLMGQRIGKRKLAELFGDTPLSFLPQDIRLIGEAVDRGLVPSDVSSSSRFGKTLTKYMKSIELSHEAAA